MRTFAVLVIAVALAAILPAGDTAVAAPVSCGTVTWSSNGVSARVYRVQGKQSCAYVRRASKHAFGERCEGEVVYQGLRCYHGAPALGQPRASGFTLKRRGANFQAKVLG